MAIDSALYDAQTVRIRPSVCLGLPWPPVLGVEHVPHWPPQVALHEEMMAQRGEMLSMLGVLDLEAKNLLPVDLERACTALSVSDFVLRDTVENSPFLSFLVHTLRQQNVRHIRHLVRGRARRPTRVHGLRLPR